MPQFLIQQSETFYQRTQGKLDYDEIEAQIGRIERMMKKYELSLPFFVKVDAWRAYTEESDFDLWILERLGWGRWKDEFRLVYAMEGLPIPHLEDAEIVTVNSASPPLLSTARELCWSEEIVAEEVHACPLTDLPEAIKQKVYPHIDQLLFDFGETLIQMDSCSDEFDLYLQSRIDDYLERIGLEEPDDTVDAIVHYFKNERRLELFQEFLESEQSS